MKRSGHTSGETQSTRDWSVQLRRSGRRNRPSSCGVARIDADERSTSRGQAGTDDRLRNDGGLTMRQMGVVGLPRNYEIFYEALTGSNNELSLELVSLGNRPKQEELDRIGREVFCRQSRPRHRRHASARRSRRQLEEITKILRNERSYLEKYGRMLDQTAEGLNGRQHDQQGHAEEDRRRDVDGDQFDHRSRQAGRQLARRQVDGAGKRQVEARGIQEARRHRSADAYLEPARLRPGRSPGSTIRARA